jgi:hypothetical protein
MEYQLKLDTIEAWQIGSTPVPAWVAELVEDKTITISPDKISIGTDDGPKPALLGDYIAYEPSVWSDPTDELEQGEVLAQRSVQLFAKADFEALYDVGSDAEELPADDINALDDAPVERAYR